MNTNEIKIFDWSIKRSVSKSIIIKNICAINLYLLLYVISIILLIMQWQSLTSFNNFLFFFIWNDEISRNSLLANDWKLYEFVLKIRFLNKSITTKRWEFCCRRNYLMKMTKKHSRNWFARSILLTRNLLLKSLLSRSLLSNNLLRSRLFTCNKIRTKLLESIIYVFMMFSLQLTTWIFCYFRSFDIESTNSTTKNFLHISSVDSSINQVYTMFVSSQNESFDRRRSESVKRKKLKRFCNNNFKISLIVMLFEFENSTSFCLFWSKCRAICQKSM